MAISIGIMIGFLVFSALGTVALNKYLPGRFMKHLLGLGLGVSLIYTGYLILFVPFEGFQDIVRLLTLYALIAGLMGYAGALLWINKHK